MRAGSILSRFHPHPHSVKIEGGALWAEIHREIEKYDLAMVGGTCSNVGIGGLVLAGGYGWLTGKYGLACDNLVGVEIVLANGEIVTASEEENKDLFWAVRGAGMAFGIVTTFMLRAFPQKNECWEGSLVFKPGKEVLKVILGVIERILGQENEEGENAMSMIWRVEGDQEEPSITTTIFHNGPAETGKEFFAPLLAANPLVNTTSMKYFSECCGSGEATNSNSSSCNGNFIARKLFKNSSRQRQRSLIGED